MPRWAGAALVLRDLVVRPLGLKTAAGQRGEGMLGLPVITEQRGVYELGMEDRHLSFTIRTELAEGVAHVRTSIWFNHMLGRAYLAVVWLPHKLILRHILRHLP
jgi:hypothetical protein